MSRDWIVGVGLSMLFLRLGCGRVMLVVSSRLSFISCAAPRHCDIFRDDGVEKEEENVGTRWEGYVC